MIVLSDIVETFFFLYEYDFDDNQRENIANQLISNFLTQNHWVDYYKNNPLYLEEDFDSDEISLEALINSSLLFIKEHKPLIFDTHDYMDNNSFYFQEGDLSSSSKECLSTNQSIATKVFDENFDENNEYYTEDQIVTLLNYYLQDRQLYYISPQTQLEHNDLLQGNLEAALGEVNEGRIAILPLHLHGNH